MPCCSQSFWASRHNSASMVSLIAEVLAVVICIPAKVDLFTPSHAQGRQGRCGSDIDIVFNGGLYGYLS